MGGGEPARLPADTPTSYERDKLESHAVIVRLPGVLRSDENYSYATPCCAGVRNSVEQLFDSNTVEVSGVNSDLIGN